jgi:hypothetical protein
MSPKKVQTTATKPGEGKGRRQVAEKYLEVAQLIDAEDGAAINVCGASRCLLGSPPPMLSALQPSASATPGPTMTWQ